MIYLLYTLHIIICIFLILVVLLQQGKGADLSVFGGGTTMAAFGARSATNLLHRMAISGFVGVHRDDAGDRLSQGPRRGSSVMKAARSGLRAGDATPAAPVAPAAAPATTTQRHAAAPSDDSGAGTAGTESVVGRVR